MTALLFIAHPDDDLIFGHGMQSNLNYFDWHVVCLTSTKQSLRGFELIAYQKHMGVDSNKIHFLDFYDDKKDLHDHKKWNNCSIDYNQAYNGLSKLKLNPHTILTHNSMGEYGHPHHILCNNLIKILFPATYKIHFGFNLVDPRIKMSVKLDKWELAREYYPSQKRIFDKYYIDEKFEYYD